MTDILPTRLAGARALRGMTQGDLAKKAALDPSVISHFEKGVRAPSLANFLRLVKALEVSADYLLGLSDFQGGGAVGSALCQQIDKLPDRDRVVIADLVRSMEKRAAVIRDVISQEGRT